MALSKNARGKPPIYLDSERLSRGNSALLRSVFDEPGRRDRVVRATANSSQKTVIRCKTYKSQSMLELSLGSQYWCCRKFLGGGREVTEHLVLSIAAVYVAGAVLTFVKFYSVRVLGGGVPRRHYFYAAL